jgi:hypothetical protein
VTRPTDSAGNGAAADTGEGRSLPVLATRRPNELAPLAAPVAPAVVAATGGFLAGVGAFVLMRLLRRPPRRVRIGARRGRRGREVAATHSFLVDVHLLRR